MSPTSIDSEPAVSARIANLLLAVAVAGLAGTLFFAAAWYRADSAAVRLADLSVEQRQALIAGAQAVLPGVHVNAWFEPRIGYTLKPSEEIEMSFDTFVANELGYRTGPAAKAPGTFRVVFVGDSWTFGHGVGQDDSLPAAFERLARRHADPEVEAWNLALPGYNAVNQLAAFWFFVEQLRPDAVVVCPGTNDNDSGFSVLPSGSLTRLGKLADELGDRHPVSYVNIGVDSYRYRERWRQVFRRYRATETRLRDLGIPLMYFFIAQWDEGVVHHLAGEGGLEAPYLVNPEAFRTGRWFDVETKHATAAANEVYGRFVYQGLARILGWPTLPPLTEVPALELFERPPAGDWAAHTASVLAGYTERFIEESFKPPQVTPKECVGPMSCQTGRMGRATTVLVRRRAGATRLAIELDRLPEARYLYPLDVTVSIPSPNGGSRVRTTVPAGGDAHLFSVEIPPDLPAGTALDVVFEAERVTEAAEGGVAGSVLIRRIEQED